MYDVCKRDVRSEPRTARGVKSFVIPAEKVDAGGYWKSENIFKTDVLYRQEMETKSKIRLSLSTIREYSRADVIKFVCQSLQVCPIARFVTALFLCHSAFNVLL